MAIGLVDILVSLAYMLILLDGKFLLTIGGQNVSSTIFTIQWCYLKIYKNVYLSNLLLTLLVWFPISLIHISFDVPFNNYEIYLLELSAILTSIQFCPQSYQLHLLTKIFTYRSLDLSVCYKLSFFISLISLLSLRQTGKPVVPLFVQ